jgi:hypothetical protein
MKAPYWQGTYGLALVLLIGACAPTPAPRPGIDGADPIPFDPGLAPLPSAQPTTAYDRNNLTSYYIRESETLCAAYIQGLTRVDRDSNLIFGTLSTLLGGLGAAFTQAAVVRPLSAAAGIASGARAEFDAATFANKTAEIIAAGIVNSRARLYNDMVVNKFPQSMQAWPPQLAMADVQNYHSKCSLYGGLLEASAAITVAPVTPPKSENANLPTGRPTGPADSVKASNVNLNVTLPRGALPTPPTPATRVLPTPVRVFLAAFARFVSKAPDADVLAMMNALKIEPSKTIKNEVLLRTSVYTMLRESNDPLTAMQGIKDALKPIHQF